MLFACSIVMRFVHAVKKLFVRTAYACSCTTVVVRRTLRLTLSKILEHRWEVEDVLLLVLVPTAASWSIKFVL